MGKTQKRPAAVATAVEALNCLSGRIDTSLNTQSAGRVQAVRRDAPVTCARCGQQVERRSPQQRYCSDRCRARDREQGRDRTRKAGLGGSTSAPHSGIKNRNVTNGLQAAQTGSSIPYNLIGGGQRQLPGAVPLDAKLRRKILHAEVGGELVSVADGSAA